MLKKLAMACIIAYQRCISPILGSSCRFYPSCSQYSLQSLEKHGFLRGSWYTIVRLTKCHPFHPGGFDPVK